jgi:hypothetical protein
VAHDRGIMRSFLVSRLTGNLKIHLGGNRVNQMGVIDSTSDFCFFAVSNRHSQIM